MAELPLPSFKSVKDIYLGDISSLNAMTDEALKQKQQEIENKYAPEKNESDIAYKKAATAYQQAQNALYPQKTQSEMNYQNALTNKANFETQNPLLGSSGIGGQTAAIDYFRKKYGEDSPQFKMINALNQQQMQSQNALMQQRLTGGFRGMGVDQKALTGFTNQLRIDHPDWSPEQVNDAANGYLTDQNSFSSGEPLPELGGQAQQLKTTMQRRNSPSATQNQAINMQVLASDLNGIDITPVTKFTGISGKADYYKNLGEMAIGAPVSQDFRDYQSFKNVTSNFAMDSLRKGFGTSVVPAYVYSTLGKASNPGSSWWSDPDQVYKEWNATKKWINENASKYKTLSTKGISAKLPEEKNGRVRTYNLETGKFE